MKAMFGPISFFNAILAENISLSTYEAESFF
jgi:hypothetical protein